VDFVAARKLILRVAFARRSALLPLGFFMPKKPRDGFVNREKLIL